LAVGRIFINYRHEDTRGDARSLFERLNNNFPRQVFMDVSKLEPGEDFVEAIEREVSSCHALIVLIGKQWLTLIAEDGRRRLDDPADFVRLEIATALKRKTLVIPALVGGASMPTLDSLPEDLQPLTRRQALHITDQDWDHDVGRLIQVLKKVLGVPPEKGAPTVSPQVSDAFPTLRLRAQDAIARGDWATAITALRECLAASPNDASAAADLRAALARQSAEQSRPAYSEGSPDHGLSPTPVQPQPTPFNPASLVGRWQLHESQAIVQVMGFMDIYPNYQFQVLVQGVVAMAGLWGYNPMAGTLELQGQNLYGLGFRGSLNAGDGQGRAFRGTCMDALGNSWTWEISR